MNKKRCLLLMTLALLFVFQPSTAAAPAQLDFAALDSTIGAQMAKHGLPGAALAVIQGDKIAYLKGYGTAGEHEMTPQTQMFIGSQSKSFTALLIAQLAEQDKLELNAPVQKYIPWFEVADEKASTRITINHFLHHTSGLSDGGYSVILPTDASREEAVRSLAQAHLTAPVGTKFQYFNLGYDVLTYIIEIVSGERYADYLKAQVLDPLGMGLTTADATAVVDLAMGYTRLFGFALPKRQPVREYEVGAGYIVSTAEDMARYSIAMMNNGGGLIKPSTMMRMFTPGLGDYGMGWNISRDGSVIYHGGANETFRTDVMIYPYRERAFVLLVNVGHQLDHFISARQLTESVEAVVLGADPVPVSSGWSVKWIGWVGGIFVLALVALHTRNFYALFNGWKESIRTMPTPKRLLDIAASFLIPTIILAVIFYQLKAFYGYRFNLAVTVAMMPQVAPDILILMLVGTLPDYVQGVIKLVWSLSGRTK